MILYQTKHFWRDIAHLAKSQVMIEILWAVGGMGVLSALTTYFLLEYDKSHHVSIDTGIFSFLGIVLSILLVFRTNTAYDRWWEARKHWGYLVNHCRNLSILLDQALPDKDTQKRREIAVLISNFCFAAKEHLRKGVKIDELIELSEQAHKEYLKKGHLPAYISSQIHGEVRKLYKSGEISEAEMINIKPHLQSFMDMLGSCERIKKTPIPFSYEVFIKLFILIYATLLPFALVTSLEYWSILIVMFIFFAFIGLEMLASEIEDPFGLDDNDLPTEDISSTIRNNVFEILTQKEYEQKAPKSTDDYQLIS